MKGMYLYRCISGHEVWETRRPEDMHRWGVCPWCIRPRTFNRYIGGDMDKPGGTGVLIEQLADSRKQRLMDKMDFDATVARMDRENEALQMRNRDLNKANGDYAGRCYFYIQDAERDGRRIDRQGRVNTDLRDENVKLRATLGLRNGTIHLLECEQQESGVAHWKAEIVRLYNRCASLTSRLENTIADRRKLEVSLAARKGQYDRQTNRLASAGIMIEDQRQDASLARVKHQTHVKRMLGVNDRLRAQLKEIEDVSSPASQRSSWADLMKVHRISREG